MPLYVGQEKLDLAKRIYIYIYTCVRVELSFIKFIKLKKGKTLGNYIKIGRKSYKSEDKEWIV